MRMATHDAEKAIPLIFIKAEKSLDKLVGKPRSRNVYGEKLAVGYDMVKKTMDDSETCELLWEVIASKTDPGSVVALLTALVTVLS